MLASSGSMGEFHVLAPNEDRPGARPEDEPRHPAPCRLEAEKTTSDTAPVVTAVDLKHRWSEPDRLRLVREVRTWLTGHGPQPAGLEEHNGRTDLRGIPLFATPVSVGDKDDPTAGATWNSLDLSGAQLEHLRFFAGRISNCVFDDASLFGMRLWGTEITDNSFRRADLRSSALGTGEWQELRNTWRRVDFSRANLGDFSITGYHVDNVVLPPQDDLVVLHNYPSVLRAAAAWLRRPDTSDEETRTAGIFDYELKAPGAEDTDQVSALNGYGDPITAAVAGRALATAQAIVG